MKTSTLLGLVGLTGLVTTGAWMAQAQGAAAPATTTAAPAAVAARTTTYTIPETNRFWFFFQQSRLFKLDTLTGEFMVLDLLKGQWNPVVIPLREARDLDENGRNISFLAQNLTNVNLMRLSDPARPQGRFRYINVYFNPDGISVPPPADGPENARGGGVSNPNYLNRLVRLDTVTGEFALMDVETATFVRVAIPTVAVGPDVNSDNVRQVSGLRL